MVQAKRRAISLVSCQLPAPRSPQGEVGSVVNCWQRSALAPHGPSKRRTRAGFTLIELLLVIGVIAILAAIVITAISPSRQFAQARNVQRRRDIKTILEAVQQHALDNKGNPATGIDGTWRMIGIESTGCAIACGQTGSTTVNVSAAADAWLFQWTPTTNYGSSVDIEVYPWSGPSVTKRGIIRFDHTSIPAEATINSARVYLHESGTRGYNRTLAFHRLTRSWTEGGVSWSRYDGPNSWTSPGGDYNVSPSATASIVWGGGPLDWDSWDVTGDMQAFVSGTLTNNGWLIRDTVEDDSQDYWFFDSKEAANASYRPYLLVDYSIPTVAGGVTAASCLDLGSSLLPTYLPSIPADPRYGSGAKTRYAIRRAMDGRLSVRACSTELGESIVVTR